MAMRKMLVALPMVALVAACGSGSSGGGAAAQLKAVGSSTVYPFTTAVAEEFQRANPGISVIVESTGSGAGLKMICAGVGSQFPDMTSSSRSITDSELADCTKIGAAEVIEFPVGTHGLTHRSAANTPQPNLSVADVYKPLAANPFGKGTCSAPAWKDVNPALPATKIRVLGPPCTSRMSDRLYELPMTKGCQSNPETMAL